MSKTILNVTNHDQTKCKIFLDPQPVGLARYDKVKYKQFLDLRDRQVGVLWKPEIVDLSRDRQDFKKLTPHEEFIFTFNLRRQIVLDTDQGRAPFQVFQPACTLPEFEGWLLWWTASENIHSFSYTYIIKNVYPDSTWVFDSILENKEILACAIDITKYYDEAMRYNAMRDLDHPDYNEYEHKKALWKALFAVNALEGVRFYVSFACSWIFAERKLMEGNANIIKMIARDENIHLGATQWMLKTLPKDDPDFQRIRDETEDECLAMYEDVVKQECEWADFLFSEGRQMLGLNAHVLKDYVHYIAGKRLKAIGFKHPYTVTVDPLPWTQKWINGSDIQKAQQETENTDYEIAQMDSNLDMDEMGDFQIHE